MFDFIVFLLFIFYINVGTINFMRHDAKEEHIMRRKM